MRSIDGDALIADCQLAQKQADRHGREFANAFYSGGGDVSTEWWCVEDMIENAPTIKPERKTGHWEITEAYPHNVYCSNCHKIFAQTHWTVWEDGSLSRNFCPNCGSYNGGEQDADS